MNLFDLTKKVAVVTGSTRGLGHAIAEAYLAAGASVVISSESAAATEQMAGAFKRAGYERVFAIAAALFLGARAVHL